jgi:transcriptional regulator with XRE-family HTH domain
MVAKRTALTRARKAAGYSQEALAEALHVASSSVSNWERGLTEPVPYKRPKLAKLLGVSRNELESLLNSGAPVHGAVRISGERAPGPSGGGTHAAEPPDDLWLSGDLSVSIAPARTESALVESLLATLQQYAVADNLAGSHPMLPIAAQQMVFVEHLLDGSRGRTRHQLLGVAARFAEFTGWLHQDAGHLRAAMQWSDTALGFAGEAADVRLTSYIQMRKSNIASDAGTPEMAVGFARDALQRPKELTPRLKAVALRQEAHGHAVAGDHDRCARALDQALQFALDAPDDDTDIARYCTSGFVEMEAAQCWVELGDPARALATLEQALTGWNSSFRRDLGMCLARLAVAHAGTGHVEKAMTIARHALTIASETRSRRTANQLYRTSDLLTTTGAHDQGQHLRQTVALALG